MIKWSVHNSKVDNLITSCLNFNFSPVNIKPVCSNCKLEQDVYHKKDMSITIQARCLSHFTQKFSKFDYLFYDFVVHLGKLWLIQCCSIPKFFKSLTSISKEHWNQWYLMHVSQSWYYKDKQNIWLRGKQPCSVVACFFSQSQCI